jgi:hypothetical protein
MQVLATVFTYNTTYIKGKVAPDPTLIVANFIRYLDALFQIP